MSFTVRPPLWELQSFERDLAVKEIEALAGLPARRRGKAIILDGDLRAHQVRRLKTRLALASQIVTPSGEQLPTTQYLLEQAAQAGRRKTTSHALHGLHPYKGKFYPQLARSLLNACGVCEGAKVLDPFAGCGTTAIEATLLGMRGLGVDANPLAVLVAKTKLAALGAPPERLRAALTPLRRPPREGPSLTHDSYLQRWLPRQNMRYLRRLLAAIASVEDRCARSFALVCLSSVLRFGSHQDPSQLRILRRPIDAQIPPLQELFTTALEEALSAVETTRKVVDVEWSRFTSADKGIVAGDARDLRASLRRHRRASFDALITSPPYANALPYIDTDRLSLHAFELLDEGGQKAAERRLIGNREISDRETRRLNIAVEREIREPKLPQALRRVLVSAQRAAREPNAGFRRRRTPALLFTYFRDMQTVLEQVATLLRPGAPAVFVLGDSAITGPGGQTLRVPTGEIVQELACRAGLEPAATMSKRLTSYGTSSMVHRRNAMSAEQIFMFRRDA